MNNARRPLQFAIRQLMAVTFVVALHFSFFEWEVVKALMAILVVACFAALPVMAVVFIASEVWGLFFRGRQTKRPESSK
jgi:hypothetical protein